MTAEHIITPPFSTSFNTVISENGGHIFIENFQFKVEGQKLSDPSQRAILGTYIVDLQKEKEEESIQDTAQNAVIFEYALNTTSIPSATREEKLLQLLEQKYQNYRILNGPEFFYGYYGYLIKLPDEDIFIGGCKQASTESILIKAKITKGSYNEHTQKILNCLTSTFKKKHHEDFLKFKISHENLYFLPSPSIHEISEKTIINIIKFFHENNLTDNPSIKKNYLKELKYSDLNELGWAASKFIEKKWLHTKTVKSGNPDFNTLKKEIDTLKEKLEIN
ncbi:hypothetical protein [Acidovorax sp. NCPPB 3576]|uniref:hypothetical protein n=1 Tax=Acidovorax sp. NCPPB 3576 TaxID=2940488 RepID=UPI00234A528F|nr:hypothetical protein [Acidovorax sp. NCPPB 3576]WCM87179.1 hypothetical protein M5C98_17660 [Acidovorax sp. NCPPB 3576]